MNEYKTLPAVALRATCVLPGMIVHFDITREKSIKAVEKAMVADQNLFLVTQKDELVEDPSMDDLFTTGTIGTVKQLIKMPKGLIRVLVEGKKRAGLISMNTEKGYIEAETFLCGDAAFSGTVPETVARLNTLKDLFYQYCQLSSKISSDLTMQILEINDIVHLVDQIGIQMPFTWEQAQTFLNAVDPAERYETLCVYLSNEIEIAQIRSVLQERIRQKLDQNQKEYVLREQIKIIREELGEDNSETRIEEYRKKCEELIAPDSVKEKIREEISRLSGIGENNPSEGGVIRGYIETLLAMPWDKASEDNNDLAKARQILKEDHYGLEKIKERILEFLAVRILSRKGDSPILCLVGPPGTGKTSIARSVARALDKKYIRMSLGGIRDEAEIRGHRRTYIGAMPGRIAAGIKTAGVKNPLMLLDEIDKVGSDYRGDTSAALLEVLDPEQNCRFSDHYIEIPLDLSEVLFIATANDAAAIPRPLLDRMEVIEISSYTDNEKEHIAKEHLIPKQKEINGIKKTALSISDKAVSEIILGYTRESGVRQLERQIAKICRKSALKMQEEGLKKVSVTGRNLEEFLGRRKFLINKANRKPEIGIVRGLAWTSVGGETLEVEVNIMPGKGEISLTGQLGDVMKESAQAGISFIRSAAKEYGIADGFFKENDIHIHIPEGAVPKDGPSAGITMATAMLSAISGIPVRADVAMTGEITLRGRVLPIGGLKEKMLAAKKAGIKTVIVPDENRLDVGEMDEEITEGLSVVYVKEMKEVLEVALVENAPQASFGSHKKAEMKPDAGSETVSGKQDEKEGGPA